MLGRWCAGAALGALGLISCATTPAAGGAQSAGGSGNSAWSLVYSQDFETPRALEGFAFSQAERWKWSDAGGRSSLELLGASDYAPPHRSPTSLALVPGLELADFDLEVELLQTGRNYGHRDMCLFFGFQSPARYYYVHLATSPDERAHNIFRVADAPRTNLAPVAEEGIDWGDGVWHRVRIERRVAAGTMRVFWDGDAAPILEAKDSSFDWGRVGFGSFDDSGRVTGVRIWAPEVRPARSAAPFVASATR